MKYDVIIRTIKTGAERVVETLNADNQISAKKQVVLKWWGSSDFNAVTQQLVVIPSKRRLSK